MLELPKTFKIWLPHLGQSIKLAVELRVHSLYCLRRLRKPSLVTSPRKFSTENVTGFFLAHVPSSVYNENLMKPTTGSLEDWPLEASLRSSGKTMQDQLGEKHFAYHNPVELLTSTWSCGRGPLQVVAPASCEFKSKIILLSTHGKAQQNAVVWVTYRYSLLY